MSLPYFPMYPTDFEAKTSHLTMAEDGAYNRLLRLMWMTQGCSLPDDDAWIMRRMRCSKEEYESVVLMVIDEFCERKNGRVSNAKLMRVFHESADAHKKRVLAGSKGGKAKSLKNGSFGLSNAKAKPKQPEPELEPDNTPPNPPNGGGEEGKILRLSRKKEQRMSGLDRLRLKMQEEANANKN